MKPFVRKRTPSGARESGAGETPRTSPVPSAPAGANATSGAASSDAAAPQAPAYPDFRPRPRPREGESTDDAKLVEASATKRGRASKPVPAIEHATLTTRRRPPVGPEARVTRVMPPRTSPSQGGGGAYGRAVRPGPPRARDDHARATAGPRSPTHDRRPPPSFVGRDDRRFGTSRDERPRTTTRDERPRTTTRDERPRTTTRDERPRTTTRDERPRTTARDERPRTTTRDERPRATTGYERPRVASRDERPRATAGYNPPPTAARDERPRTTARDERPRAMTRDERPRAMTRDERPRTENAPARRRPAGDAAVSVDTALYTPSDAASPRAGQRRAFSNVGGPAVMSGDAELAAVLRDALEAADNPDEARGHVHGFHSYPARLHPRTARIAIERLCGADDVVLDPFCGSGTVLVEARLAGRAGVGVDANPLAVRLALLKAEGRNDGYAEAMVDAARRVAAVADERREQRLGASHRFPDEDRDAFDPHVLLELDGLRLGLDALGDAPEREDLELVLSAILTKVGRRSGDTAESEKPKRIAAGYPAKLFVKKTAELRARFAAYRALLPPHAPLPLVREGDARNLSRERLPQAALVVTSPPYPGNYDYLQHHAARLRWLGLDARAFDEREIGARRRLDVLPFDEAIDQWRGDLRACLAGVRAAVREGGFALFVIADSVVAGRAVDNERVLAAAAHDEGLFVVAGASQERPHFHAPTRAAFRDSVRREHALLLGRRT